MVLWKEFRVSLIMTSVLVGVIMIRVAGFGSEASLPAVLVSSALASVVDMTGVVIYFRDADRYWPRRGDLKNRSR